MTLVAQAVPDIFRAERRSASVSAQTSLLARGIVALTDPGLGPGAMANLAGQGSGVQLQALQSLAQELMRVDDDSRLPFDAA